MSVCRSKRGKLREAIQNGITKRGFYIVSAADQIPNCHGGATANLEGIQQFARENGWHVAVHERNGWLLFTTDRYAAVRDIEDDRDSLAGLVESSLWGNSLPRKAIH